VNPLDALVGKLDTPLFVVTAASSGIPQGCLVGFATQCSIHPPRLLVCLSVENRTYAAAAESQALAVHLLGRDQHDMASLFGEHTGDNTEKFGRCAWEPGRTGSPVLSQCAAWVEGDVLERHRLGDHVGFVLAPVDGGPGNHPDQFTMRAAHDLEAGHPA
jgi:flavin reductase (DIM6/NTAB) family NADH-FMN oxidoreductase RutF